MLKQGSEFLFLDKRLFEITEVEITRVDCNVDPDQMPHYVASALGLHCLLLILLRVSSAEWVKLYENIRLKINTVELLWLEHLWHYDLFKTGVVQDNGG